MAADVLVLGAGMVGVSAALHLQQRGRSVVLVDRRGAAEETSHGNAGLIQREGIVPYTFPRDVMQILKVGLNMTSAANLHYSALPTLAPWLFQYWRQGSARNVAKSAMALKPIVERCLIEHEALMADAGITGMLRREGYMRLYRTEAALRLHLDESAAHKSAYGIQYEAKTPAELGQMEPHLSAKLVGAILFPDPVSVADPAKVGKAYADLFVARGGRFVTGDARTLEAVSGGWQIGQVDGPIVARDAVIAMGPWAGDVMRGLGRPVPLAVKRGYHMHFSTRGNATLNRPVVDDENGYLLTPMTRGIRLTTGAEFASLGAAPTPVQLDKVEPFARELLPLADRVDTAPWLGNRPCLPDMVPMIGPVPGKPGLWADFGHHHLGFTLGPVSGRLLAEMITKEPTFTDPWPYRADRFGMAMAA